jgi:hypothetical protein
MLAAETREGAKAVMTATAEAAENFMVLNVNVFGTDETAEEASKVDGANID